MMTINTYTIGTTKKTARSFFELLKENKVSKIIDIRLRNNSQLAGFAKGKDLSYFAGQILNAEYVHEKRMSPTKELLDGYKKANLSWAQYEIEFHNIMNTRKIEKIFTPESLHQACFLCSEEQADHCHRRLVVEYLASKTNLKINIKHL